jgi:hypothetical protein
MWVTHAGCWDRVGVIKDDECGLKFYKGDNLIDQTGIYRLKENIKDHECGWS